MNKVKKEIDKELYSFSVEIEKEVEEVTEKVDDNGEKTKITKMVKKPVPITLRIMRPTRRQLDEAGLEYSKELSKMIKLGLLTKAMIVKKYADTGGVLTEEESRLIMSMQKESNELMLKFLDLSTNKKRTPEQDQELKEVTEKLNEVRTNLAKVESSYSSLFDETADVKAMNHTVLWYILMLTKISKPKLDENGQETDDVEWVDFFKGDDFEEKKDDLYQKEDEDDEIYALARKKLTYFVSFWYNGAAVVRDDFDSLNKDLDENKI